MDKNDRLHQKLLQLPQIHEKSQETPAASRFYPPGNVQHQGEWVAPLLSWLAHVRTQAEGFGPGLHQPQWTRLQNLGGQAFRDGDWSSQRASKCGKQQRHLESSHFKCVIFLLILWEFCTCVQYILIIGLLLVPLRCAPSLSSLSQGHVLCVFTTHQVLLCATIYHSVAIFTSEDSLFLKWFPYAALSGL